jgi:hypothetical protein
MAGKNMGDHGSKRAMTISPEVEELVRQVMLAGDYPSENAVLLAALRALGERRQAEEGNRRESLPRVSPLGVQLRDIRAQYVAGGGELITAEQLDREIAQRRGECNQGD